MTAAQSPYEDLLRLVRVARGLEAGGYYNAAKLFWAAAYSHEIRLTNAGGQPMAVPVDPDELALEIQAAIDSLKAAGADLELITAMVRGKQGLHENRTISLAEIPQVYTCRKCGEIILGQPGPRCHNCGADALTLREFPPVWFLEPLQPQEALNALASAPDLLSEVLQGLKDPQLNRPPQTGEWTIREAFQHLLISQELLAGRVEKMLAEDEPSLVGVAAWAMGKMEQQPALEILERYRRSRRDTLESLRMLSAEDWWRTAWHEEFGRVTLLQQASYFARHERDHFRQILAIRDAVRDTML